MENDPKVVERFKIDVSNELTEEGLRTIRFALEEYLTKLGVLSKGSDYEDLASYYCTMSETCKVLEVYNRMMMVHGLDL